MKHSIPQIYRHPVRRVAVNYALCFMNYALIKVSLRVLHFVAGLVEWVHTEHVAAYAAGFLKGANELAQVFLS